MNWSNRATSGGNACLLLSVALLLTAQALRAGEIALIDEDFEDPFTGYVLQPAVASVPADLNNTTAEFTLGDVEGSTGLVFAGTWDVAPGTSGSSAGFLFPTGNFQFDPAANGGIVSVSFAVDAILNGFPGDDIAGLFLELMVSQQQADGSVKQFAHDLRPIVSNLDLQRLGATVTESDFDFFADGVPDFSANGRPLSFGLVLGLNQVIDPAGVQFVAAGHLRVDNWTVNVDFGIPAADGTISGVDFGAQIVATTSGSQQAMVTSSGSDNLLVTGPATLTANPDAAFTIVSDDCDGQDLGTSGTCTVDLTCTPASLGLIASQLRVPTNAGDLDADLSCEGVAEPAPSGSIAPLDFGPLLIGSQSSLDATLISDGTADLIVTGPAIIETDPQGAYSITSDLCDGQDLGLSGSCAVTVSCSPSDAGLAAGNLQIPTNAGALNGALSCTGGRPDEMFADGFEGDPPAGFKRAPAPPSMSRL